MDIGRSPAMTLLVCRIVDDRTLIVSDTKLSFDDAVHARPLHEGALKSLVVSPTCCVGFAGDIAVAESALAPVLNSQTWSKDNIVGHLLDAHLTSKGAAEFIVANTATTCQLIRIKGGVAETNLENAWIGDSHAFELYQSYYHGESAVRRHSFQRDTFTRMKDALDNVIGDSTVPSVDGFTICVSSRSDRSRTFGYQPYIVGSGFQPVENTTEPTSLMRTIGVAGGSYNFAILVPKTLGVAAIGIYILETNAGALMFPASSWTPALIRNVTCQWFIDSVEATVGLSLTGMLFG